MSMLLSPLKIGNLKLKNRIIMPPMCLYKAKDDNGYPHRFHRLHYAARALGGVGLIIVEASAISPNGRITHSDLGLYNDKQVAKHAKLIKECVRYGAKMGVQLAHAGRKSMCETTPIAPSAIKFSDECKMPREMSQSDIKDIKAEFVMAAKRAVQAGYELIEIHAAHGYLINEFLSKLANNRTDKYGGSFENRARLLLEILREVKSEVSVPVGVRVSADTWQSGDYDITQSVRLAKELEGAGADFIHVSAGGVHPKPDRAPKFTPLYQAQYAREIKAAVSVPIIAVGLITTGAQGEALLIGGACDAVAYGRELLRNPNFAQMAMAQLGENELIETSYQRAF